MSSRNVKAEKLQDTSDSESDEESDAEQGSRVLKSIFGCCNPQVGIHEGNHPDEVHIADYDVTQVSTFAVFCIRAGTVFYLPVLWCQTIFIMALFFAIGVGVHTYADFENCDTKTCHLRVDVKRAEGFVGQMSVLVTFLLGFYTSATYARWWMQRAGCGKIAQSAHEITLIMSQVGKQDKELLRSISRYASASLLLIALRRRFGAGKHLKRKRLVPDDDHPDNPLTDDELRKLKKVKNNHAQAVWTWISAAIEIAHDQKKIPNGPIHAMLHGKVLAGTEGVQAINGLLSTPIPLPYVHLLALMVKTYSLMTAILLGLVWAQDYGHTFAILKTFLLPFLFNSLLAINDVMSDPFGGDINDFPISKYARGIVNNCQSFIDAGDNAPGWIATNK